MPSREEFLRGCAEFENHERRDAMYKVASYLIENFWGKSADMSDALGVLLLTWNHAFYRYGMFDFNRLEDCIEDNLSEIASFRRKGIFELSDSSGRQVKSLFLSFLEALQIDSGRSKGKKSPVAVAKALHLLAPTFFPLWDQSIAEEYGCYYNKDPAEMYLEFCGKIREFAVKAKEYTDRKDKTLVKLIDEYNYAKFTEGWI